MSTLLSQLQDDLTNARRDRDPVVIAVLSTLIGELQNDALRKGGKEATNEVIIRKIKQFIAANEETIQAAEEHGVGVGLSRDVREENELLASYLPDFWDKTEIMAGLHSHTVTWYEIMDATNHGKAVGIAMKWLRQVQAPVEGATVADAVLAIRKGG
jgi:uncharacterized protein YqeY